MIPGEIVCEGPAVELFAGRTLMEMAVVNAGDRPIQVGSHYHFAEANPGLRFDRAASHGKRLAIPAGTSMRFEPGIERTVSLVDLGGRRAVLGLRGQVAGLLDESVVAGAQEAASAAVPAGPGDKTGGGGSVRWI